jgi:pimeloyl-ACP methyl ester carboxylesterase
MEDTHMSSPEQFQIEHSGVRMQGLVQGTGEPVLLVHGMPSSLNVWRFILDRVASRYRVIAMDLPGFGQSTKVALPSLDAFADWLVRVLDHFSLPSAHIVGHSFGGLISLALLDRQPQRLRSLVLSDTVGLGPYTGGEFQRLVATARTADDIRSALHWTIHDPRFISQPLVDGYVAYVNQPGVPALLEKLTAQRPEWESYISTTLEKIKLPLLVMWGRDDRSVAVELADRLRHVPGARFVVFDNCGHAPMVERAEDFGTHLLDFLDGVVKRGGKH